MKRDVIFKTSRIIGFLWILLTVGAMSILFYFQNTGQFLETDLMALFPAIEKDVEIETALNRVREASDRRVVFLVGHKDQEVAIANAEEFSFFLSQDPAIGEVHSRVSEKDERQWWYFYSQFSSHLLTPNLRKLLAKKGGEIWRQNVLTQVYSPFAAVSAEELRVDPMLLTRNFLLELRKHQNQLNPENGWLIAKGEDGISYVFISAILSIKPYSLVDSKLLVTRIDQIAEKLSKAEPYLKWLRQGTLFYAAHGINQAKEEMSTIGVGSILGVCFLLILIFRSAKPFFLGALSILSGLLFATVTTVLVFKDIHIFTLVIGASLIGVSIDYSFHFLCEWLSGGDNWQPLEALRVILPAICMGFLTSILAYLVLLLTPFPGLRQLAVFSSAGLFAAFATVIFLYPLFLKAVSSRPLPWAPELDAWVGFFHQSKIRWIVCIVLAGLSLITIPMLNVNDDIRQLQAAPENLRHQGAVITSIVGNGVGQKLLLVRGDDEETVLHLLEEVGDWLDKAVNDGVLESYRSLSKVLPTVTRQEEDFHLARAQLMRPWLPGLVEQIGLDKDTLSGFFDTPFKPLTVGDWLKSSVSEGWRMLWLGMVGEHYGAMVTLNNVKEPSALESIEGSLVGVDYISRADELSELFRYYRLKVCSLLIASYLGIFLLLCLRYGLIKAGLILLAPMLAGASSLAVLSIAGLPLNLFGVLGLILVLGIGIDYTLFLAECRKRPTATLLAVVLSATTTLISFGLLCLSETTAIRTFGLVVLVGILVALVLAPMAYNGQAQSGLE